VLGLNIGADVSVLNDCGTLLNRRKKLSDVCRAISTKETPRVSAKIFAVSTT
jgi:hypothetical protein